MSRLRHPIRAIREPFGTAGLMVAIVALVFAMIGGAYAASSDGGGKATASAKSGKQGKPGKRGPRGKTGATGSNGAMGAQGPAGASGKDGINGEAGAPGKDGEGVTSTNLAEGDENCEFGGSEFAAAEESVTYACNGSPWTAGGTLPTGSTESGTWGLRGANSGAFATAFFTPVSFSIPLAAALPESNVHLLPTGGEDANCSDGVNPPASVEHPEADPGHLCVFVGLQVGGTLAGIATPYGEEGGAGISGALVNILVPKESTAFAYGTFAVTG